MFHILSGCGVSYSGWGTPSISILIVFSKKRLLSLGSSLSRVIPIDSAIGLVDTFTASVRTAAAIWDGLRFR